MAPIKHFHTKEHLEKLYFSGLTKLEMANVLNLSIGTIKYLLSKHKIRIRKKPEEYPPLTPIQIEVINGSLLGDAWLGYVKNKNSNCNFAKKQSKNPIGQNDRLEYLRWTSKIFDIYSSKISFEKSDLKIKFYSDRNIIKTIETWIYRTVSHPIFTELSLKWYKNTNGVFHFNKYGKVIKVVPPDLILTPLSLAIWFCDDGIHEPKDRKCTICSNCFSEEENLFLIERLKCDLDLNCSLRYYVKKQPQIYIPTQTYLKFIHTIKTHIIWDCFKYKVDLSNYKEPISMKGETHPRSTLTNETVQKIFDMHQLGIKQIDISDELKVSRPQICNILNGKKWKHFIPAG